MLRRLAARMSASTGPFRHQMQGLAGYGRLDDGFWEQLEEILLTSDMGPEVGLKLAADLRAEGDRLRMKTSTDAVNGLRTMLLNRMEWRPRGLNQSSRPLVYLVVGVNGTGKTTTVAKLGARFIQPGERVILGAADTFRAGAIQQLREWAERVGAELVAGEPGADPASVAFASVEAALARGAAAVVIDTAGRLHTQSNLMEELRKIERSVGKAMPGAPHETLLVLDAAIGQNSVQQARIFHQALHLSGVVMAKLDGSARGGVILGLEEELGVPVKLIGTGEQPQDLELFDPGEYVESLFGASS